MWRKLGGAAESGQRAESISQSDTLVLRPQEDTLCLPCRAVLQTQPVIMASLLKAMLTGSGSGKDGMRRTGSFDDLSMGAGRDGEPFQLLYQP